MLTLSAFLCLVIKSFITVYHRYAIFLRLFHPQPKFRVVTILLYKSMQFRFLFYEKSIRPEKSSLFCFSTASVWSSLVKQNQPHSPMCLGLCGWFVMTYRGCVPRCKCLLRLRVRSRRGGCRYPLPPRCRRTRLHPSGRRCSSRCRRYPLRGRRSSR